MTRHAHYRQLKAMIANSPQGTLLHILDLEADLDKVSRSYASRLEQLKFTDHCALHGLDYSPSCGACSCARTVAEYGTTATNQQETGDA